MVVSLLRQNNYKRWFKLKALTLYILFTLQNFDEMAEMDEMKNGVVVGGAFKCRGEACTSALYNTHTGGVHYTYAVSLHRRPSLTVAGMTSP